MKLEKYEDKSKKRRKIILISISVIVLISVSLLLYKTFANLKEKISFSNDNVYFAFYNGDEKLNEMPGKDNEDNLGFSYGLCDNGAIIDWDNDNWAPLVKNLIKSKTKCSLYFDKKQNAIEYFINLAKINSNDLGYDGKEFLGDDLGTNDNNLRYIGANPNNYIRFNNEIWRVIGIMKVKTLNGMIEDRIKIVRTNGIKGQSNFKQYIADINNSSDWSQTSIAKLLNNMYYNSTNGDCYSGNDGPIKSTCDFKNGEVKGLNEKSRKMIDKEVIWNIGYISGWLIPKEFYEGERGNQTFESRPVEWSSQNDPNYNGIGLIYISDYGYAVGGENREICLANKPENTNIEFQKYNCNPNDWLSANYGDYWTMTPYKTGSNVLYVIRSGGYIGSDYVKIRDNIPYPVIYLKKDLNLIDDKNLNYGSIENPFRLSF